MDKNSENKKKRSHASLEWWQNFHFGWTIPHNKVYSCTVKFLLILNEGRWLVSTCLSFQLCACLIYLWVVATKLLAFLILSAIVKPVTYCVYNSNIQYICLTAAHIIQSSGLSWFYNHKCAINSAFSINHTFVRRSTSWLRHSYSTLQSHN